MNSERELRYLLALNKLRAIGLKKLTALLTITGSIEQLFKCNKKQLLQFDLTEKQAQAISAATLNDIHLDLTWAENKNHHLVDFQHPLYPTILAEIGSPPLILYLAGNIDLLNSTQIAMVGSRKPSPTGQENAYHFARSLAQLGFTICSGMALGIDAASHQGALSQGNSTAVLGTGLDIIYPKSNQKLFWELCEQGAVISEFAIGSKPSKNNFPIRNRIISGLSIASIVVEAAIKSGSLITAKAALQQGREVFAIPGSIHNPQARGCHHLIKEGAVLVEKIDDILLELNPDFVALNQQSLKKRLDLSQPDADDTGLLAYVGEETTSVEAIIVRSNMPASKVSSILTELELDGQIKSVTGGYCRVRKT